MSDTKAKEDERQRAHRGSGTIRTRKDGRMEKRVSLGVDEQGHRTRISVYGRNLNELHANARDAIRRHNAAKLASARERGTLADFFDNPTDGWLTLKETEGGQHVLTSYNPEYRPIWTSEITIYGVVVEVRKRRKVINGNHGTN